MKQRIYLALAAGMMAIAAAFVPGASSRGDSTMAAGAAKPAATTMPLYPGLGPVHHPVTTASPLAQKYFDQGLAFTYGFNHDEAERSFEQAAQIDPKMAMAFWGIALVLGPNYNLPGDPARAKKAYDAVGRARALEPGASPEERALIEAVARALRREWRGLNRAGPGVRERDAHGGAQVPRRPRRADAVRGIADGPASVAPVEHRRQARPRHDRDRDHARDRAQEGSQQYRRQPLLHPCGRGVARSRARDGERRPARRAGAWRRPPGAHALAHLYPHRALPRRGRDQRERDQGGPGLLCQKQGGRRLSADVLHAQHPFPLLLRR